MEWIEKTKKGKTMTPLLELKNLNKRFGGIIAVKDFDLRVEKGDIIGLIGPNGAGKTTLFNLITGFLKPDSGTIFFKGKNITKLKPHKIANMGLARTFQLIKPFKRMLAIENVAVGYYSDRFKKKRKEKDDIPKKAFDTLKRVGINPPETYKFAASLSHGYSRRLDISRALVLEPEVLLLDEPFGGLGTKESRLLTPLIKKLQREDNLTMIIIEHKMQQLMKIAGKLVVMQFGEKIAEGNCNQITNDPKVCEAYLGKGGNGYFS
jgi:branched-chain amino acid transport system ATP-binding protein